MEYSKKSRFFVAGKDFNVLRRKWLDQIFRHDRLGLTDRIVGYAIMRHTNRATGCTFVHPSTLARDIGTKHSEARNSIARIASVGLLTVRPRGDLSDLFPMLPLNASPPTMRAGTKSFQRATAEWLAQIMSDLILTPSHRVAAYAIMALTDPTTGMCFESRETIANLVRLSGKSIQRAISALVEHNYVGVVNSHGSTASTIRICVPIAAQGQAGGQPAGHYGGQPSITSAVKSTRYIGNPENSADSGNLPSPTDSATIATRPQRGRGLYWIDDIASIIAELFDPEEPVRISSLIAAAHAKSLAIYFDRDLQPLLESGHLDRVSINGNWVCRDPNGKFLRLTHAGLAYCAGYDQAKAA